jgi:hypothetical protein
VHIHQGAKRRFGDGARKVIELTPGAAQIDPLIPKLLDRPGLQKEVSDALSQSLPTVIRYLGTVVTAETSSSEDRLAASNNLFWIYGISQKYSAMLQRLDTRKTVEQKKRALWEARRASALAKKEGAVLEVEKQKRKHARKLTKALADEGRAREAQCTPCTARSRASRTINTTIDRS